MILARIFLFRSISRFYFLDMKKQRKNNSTLECLIWFYESICRGFAVGNMLKAFSFSYHVNINSFLIECIFFRSLLAFRPSNHLTFKGYSVVFFSGRFSMFFLPISILFVHQTHTILQMINEKFEQYKPKITSYQAS